MSKLNSFGLDLRFKMAAPMSEETMSEPEEEEPGEINEINPLSPYFNPLKALYSSKIALPFPEASVFDNLYQYERVTGSREQARQGGVRDRGKDGGAAGSRAASHGGQPHGPSQSVPVAQQNIKSSRPVRLIGNWKPIPTKKQTK